MKSTSRSNQLRKRAALALAASRDAGNAVDRDNLLTRANGLEMLAAAEEWLDGASTIRSAHSRVR